MTLITLGTSPTISAPTLEEMLVALIDFGQSQELNSSKNPNQINNMTSSLNRDSSLMNVSINFPCNVNEGTNALEISGVDYLTGVVFTFGSGGGSDLKGSNWVDAIVRTLIKQKSLELNSSKNPTQANNISYGIAPSTIIGSASNATFSAQCSLPVVYEGTYPVSYKGLVYLGDL